MLKPKYTVPTLSASLAPIHVIAVTTVFRAYREGTYMYMNCFNDDSSFKNIKENLYILCRLVKIKSSKVECNVHQFSFNSLCV